MKMIIVLTTVMIMLSYLGITNAVKVIDINSGSIIRSKLDSIFNFNREYLKKKENLINYINKINAADNFKFKTKNELNEMKTKTETNISTSLQNENKSSQSDFSLHQGWMKYLEITEDSTDVPSCFNKNQVYFLQMSENSGINTLAKDNIGYVNIPNEEYFYMELTQSKLNIYTGRNSPYRKLQKSLALDDLIPQTTITPCKGGVEDVGNFAEGFCFMLKYINFSRHIIWELCSETVYQKDKWINKILDVTTKKGMAVVNASPIIGIGVGVSSPFSLPAHGVPMPMPLPIPNMFYPHGQISPASTLISPLNPFIPIPVIQPIWSTCSEPCGPGVQTRPLDCMDENLCRGKKFEERLCNIKACKEHVEKQLEKLKKVADGNFLIDPKNIVIDASEMFNREMFDECKLLEGNLIMVVNNEKILSHVEVNMQSVQIFSKNNPNIPIVIPLNSLAEVRPSASVSDCFSITGEKNNVISLCPQIPQVNACEVWVKRILEFKQSCSNKLLNKFQTDIALSIESSKDPNANSNRLKLMQTNALLDEKRRSTIKEKVLVSQFEDFKRETRDLLEKEDAYETKLEQQEKERIEWEDNKMRDTANKEKEITNKILNDLQTLSNSDNSYHAKEMSIKREMKNMMNEVQSKISQKREKLISKLQRMRTMHDLGEKKTAMEMMDMKREMGKKLTSLSKQGNPSQCFTKNIALMNNYCVINYLDLEMQVECKKPNQFCYLCCDHEIPNKPDQACCYNKCDENKNNACYTFNEEYHIVNQQVAYLN